MDALDYLDATARHWQLAAFVATGLLVCFMVVTGFVLLSNRRYLRRRRMVWLEITPPGGIDKSPEATEQLFSVIHGVRAARNLKDRVLQRVPVSSFEIVSTRESGIRYLLYVEAMQSRLMQKAIVAYIPDAKVRAVEREVADAATVLEFKQTGHYVLPLTLTAAQEQHDPLAYVLGAMSNLEDNEEITLQLLATPIRLREAELLSHRILGNEDVLRQVGGNGFQWMRGLKNILAQISAGLTDLASEVYRGVSYEQSSYDNSRRNSKSHPNVVRDDRPARTLSAFEQELMASMHQKVTLPLFRVNLRVLITSPQATQHAVALRSALDGYSVPSYQSLKVRLSLPFISSYRRTLAMNRLPSLFRRSSLIFASSELASLYHFPARRISKTDNLIASLSRTLPAPVALKANRQLGISIGENHHHETVTPIGLTHEERERHMYIVGGTGNGKTTMLFYQILQDIRAGSGVAVVDPHGDLAERILRYIPEDRIKDVIYINPDDLSYPIGMNLLELAPNLAGDELLREKDLITEATISVLRKIFSDDDSGGHRIEYVLRNTIQTALTLENPTLFTIYELLNDAKFRRQVVKGLKDKSLKDFWRNELGKAGDMQKVKMVAGITAKIGRFLFSASAKRMLEQPKSTIDFEAILFERKILICNFSKGLIGEDTSALFGTAVLARLQTAAMRRAKMHLENRSPYYLYVDEFQNFATTSFVQMLSEARKYKLFLTMAEQSTSQQDEQRLVDIILANVGTVVCFRSGSPADERLLLPLFTPFITQGEIANLPAYSYYVRIAAVEAQEPMSGVTVVVHESGSEVVARRVIASSRKLYAKKVDSAPVVSVSAGVKTRQARKARIKRKAVASHGTVQPNDELAGLKSVV